MHNLQKSLMRPKGLQQQMTIKYKDQDNDSDSDYQINYIEGKMEVSIGLITEQDFTDVDIQSVTATPKANDKPLLMKKKTEVVEQKPFLLRCQNQQSYKGFTQLKEYMKQKEIAQPLFTKAINYKKN